MKIEYDPAKNQRNIALRGISFELAKEINLSTASIELDQRQEYGELRYNLLGYINERLYHMTFTQRGDTTRIISLRKANN